MFQGIAAARVKALFKDARENAPSIVFIDEVDAIGLARNPEGYRDAGSAEREQGLMQLLVEMDGFSPADKVLVVAATNRRDVLDEALLRPGRFDRTIHMGVPTPENRYQILKVHARGKQIPRDDDDAVLREAARKAVGYSGAELANMLNEAAILQVLISPPSPPAPCVLVTWLCACDVVHVWHPGDFDRTSLLEKKDILLLSGVPLLHSLREAAMSNLCD
jgi:cell division protease FtsH